MSIVHPSLIFSGDTSNYNANTCKKPDFGKWRDCNGIGAGYYYDDGKKYCVVLTDTGCPNQTLFRTRKNCTDVCESDEGPEHCAKGPESPCSGTDRGRKRYFYNITTQVCSAYPRCGVTRPSLGENSFYTNNSCQQDCGGFTENDVKSQN
ncbi:uncharacterized protein LOC119458454 [Dermacentor silvarum]|uniref:uncharacterized protein LOC119458454 n=1 Tax=Dermacentor silvarum TaxID=543639 RepID=UPI00210128C7|nr:uncharacterized protein LOC119458454 [Dermacentor silvarum]